MSVEQSEEGCDIIKIQENPHDGKNLGKYSVKGLCGLEDRICSNHLNTEKEVLLVALHESISMMIHKIALFLNRVSLKDIKKDSVRDIFEKTLRDYFKNGDDLGWLCADFKIVEKYFEENGRNPKYGH